jgi:hypothetical protein
LFGSCRACRRNKRIFYRTKVNTRAAAANPLRAVPPNCTAPPVAEGVAEGVELADAELVELAPLIALLLETELEEILPPEPVPLAFAYEW